MRQIVLISNLIFFFLLRSMNAQAACHPS